MNEKTTMMINEGMLIWAFGCAVNHEDTAAIVLAILAVLYTIHTYSASIRANVLKGLAAVDLCLVFAHMCGLSHIVPAIGAVIAANTFFAVMTLANSWKLMDQAVKVHTWLLLGYGAMAFILPSDQFTFAQLLALLLLIFAPVMAVYAARVFAESPEKTYHGGRLTNDIE